MSRAQGKQGVLWRAQVWKRLLWKEARESLPTVVIALVAPAVIFPFFGGPGGDTALTVIPVLVASLGVHLMVVFWAAGKADRKKNGTEFRAHMPITPLADWSASFAIPALVSALLGVWYGAWALAADSRSGEATYFHLAKSVLHSTDAVTYALSGALDMTAAFVVSYFFALVLSKWAGILAGVAHTLGGNLISPWSLDLLKDRETVGFIMRITIGTAAASLIFAALGYRRTLAFKQAVSLVVLLLIVFVPLVGGIDVHDFVNPPLTHQVDVWGYRSASETFRVLPADHRRENDDERTAVKYAFIDNRTGESLFHVFEQVTQVIWAFPDGRVYLAHQPTGKRDVRILLWNSRRDTVTQVANLPARANTLLLTDGALRTVDPSGRYILLSLHAQLGDSYDLWALDLRTHRGDIVLPNSFTFPYDSVGWSGAKALLACDKLLEVNLRSMTLARPSLRRGRD